MNEPDWNACDFDSWGDEADWQPDWRAKARVALARHFSHINLTVEYLGASEGFRFKLPHRSSYTTNPRAHFVQADAYMNGFIDACEAMAEVWDCRQRPEPTDMEIPRA